VREQSVLIKARAANDVPPISDALRMRLVQLLFGDDKWL